jgi:hypothetical protein
MTATTAPLPHTLARRDPLAWATLAGGIVCAGVFWWVSWGGPEPFTHIAFFPLWLGYILTIDGLVQLRGRRSLLRRAPLHWAGLFVLSSPVWWAFELMNERLDNWAYQGGELFSPFAYAFWATVAFSTVIPAVFESAELLATFIGSRFPAAEARTLRRATGWWAVAAGVAGIGLIVVIPRVAYPLAWIAPWLVFDGLNLAAGQRTILEDLATRHWRRPLTLAAAGLLCGFFWEMWNWEAYPRWVYDVPIFGFWKIFEMPLLGYGGYVPFAWSLYAFYRWVTAVTRIQPQL